jgi:polyphosphate glucokinase
MIILSVDIGGSSIKAMRSGDAERRSVPSGPTYSPEQFRDDLPRLAGGQPFGAISIGFPSPVRRGRILREPANLGPGWTGFDLAGGFGVPCRVVNDAILQAIGSYRGERMLFLGLGTGLGTALIDDYRPIGLEAAHLPFRKGEYEDYLGARGLERLGERKWRKRVLEVAVLFQAAFVADSVVIGGGNARLLEGAELPRGVELGDNQKAFLGGFRLWDREWLAATA